MKVCVERHEGYRTGDPPQAFHMGDRRIEIMRILDQWTGGDHDYIKIEGSDGPRYLLRHDRSRDEWEIRMMEWVSPGA